MREELDISIVPVFERPGTASLSDDENASLFVAGDKTDRTCLMADESR